MLQQGALIDGYALLQPIGRGGFGEVWLCRNASTGECKALKFLPQTNPQQLERELKAVIRYQSVAARLRGANLVPIEHVNRSSTGFYYTMPLADGLAQTRPETAEWRPKTLASLIELRRDDPYWFRPEEVRWIMEQLLTAVEALEQEGIVHRDIKPENVIFLQGLPCLADVSLLAADTLGVTRYGTPGYSAPSWYLESAGHPDFWGLAATFYHLLTGHHPDRMGRTAFLWPPHGQASLSEETQAQWRHFHDLIRRITRENPTERFLRFEDFRGALTGTPPPPPPLPRAPKKRPLPRFDFLKVGTLGVVGALLLAGVLWQLKERPEPKRKRLYRVPWVDSQRPPLRRSFETLFRHPLTAIPSPLTSNETSERFPAGLEAVPILSAQLAQSVTQSPNSQRPSTARPRWNARTPNNPRIQKLMDLAIKSLELPHYPIATEYARDLLILLQEEAASNKASSIHEKAYHAAHIVLGHCCLAIDEVALARQHLLESANIHDATAMRTYGPDMSLAQALLHRGETTIVLQYFEACQPLWPNDDNKLQAWKRNIEEKSMPNFGSNLGSIARAPASIPSRSPRPRPTPRPRVQPSP